MVNVYSNLMIKTVIIMGFFNRLIAAITAFFAVISSLFTMYSSETAEFTEPSVRIQEQYDMGDFVMKSCDLIVSPDGNDSFAGTLEQPLKTVAAAKEKVKALINADVGAVTVWLRGGTYIFDETLSFTADDLSDVTYRAYPGEKVIFTGSEAVFGWHEETVNGVKAWVTQTNLPYFNILSNGTQTLERTRMPESGYYYVEEACPQDDAYPDADELFRGSTSFIADSNIVGGMRNSSDIAVRILHRWKDEFVTVKGFDTATNKLSLSRPTSMTVNKGDKYFLQNVFEALNSAGEWYLDRATGKLYYIPFEGEDIESTVLFAGLTEQLITVDGVNNITFKDIVFADNGFNIPKNNSAMDSSSQAGYDAIPCLYVMNSCNASIIGCTFRNIGGCCVKFGTNVEDATVKSCMFNNIGAQAVFVQGLNVQLDDECITKNISITDNQIYKYGRTFYNSVGILIINANSCDISNNEIHDGYYTAISVGWVWGYSYSVTDNNRICDNLIYDIGQGWLSDMGGIYTLGTQLNTVISGNCIHNVAADAEQGGYGGWGIYLDEGSSGVLVEKNLVYDCGSQSFHQHYGKENIVRNNIFALSGDGQLRVSRKEEHNSLTLERNIFLSDDSPIYCSVKRDKNKDNGNLYWDYTNKALVMSSKGEGLGCSERLNRIEMAYLGYYVNGTFADPMFRDAAHGDFTLADNSPALEIGFEPWDYLMSLCISFPTMRPLKVMPETTQTRMKTENGTLLAEKGENPHVL